MVELTGEYEFAAPQELVWEMILNPEILSMTIAGCERLEKVDDNTMHGRLNLRVGPVQGIFLGEVKSTDVQAPNSLHMIVSGNGPAGAVRGEGNIILEALPTTTRLRYDGAVQVSGRIASVGQRVMDSSAKSIVKQSLQNLEKHIQAYQASEAKSTSAVESPSTAAAYVAPTAPDQTQFVLNVARDVVHDLMPDAGRRNVLIGMGLAVILIGLINAFANLVARRVVKILREE
jgi:carbon monoxide dehydrogenase subunit G